MILLLVIQELLLSEGDGGCGGFGCLRVWCRRNAEPFEDRNEILLGVEKIFDLDCRRLECFLETSNTMCDAEKQPRCIRRRSIICRILMLMMMMMMFIFIMTIIIILILMMMMNRRRRRRCQMIIRIIQQDRMITFGKRYKSLRQEGRAVPRETIARFDLLNGVETVEFAGRYGDHFPLRFVAQRGSDIEDNTKREARDVNGVVEVGDFSKNLKSQKFYIFTCQGEAFFGEVNVVVIVIVIIIVVEGMFRFTCVW